MSTPKPDITNIIFDENFKKLPNQEWKKTCTDCYYKSKK